jgi:hypothetical protein
MATKTKIRWGDTLDDEDGALPPTTVKGPDSNGVKTAIEYYRNDKGESFKKVLKTKVVNVEKKVYKVCALVSAGRRRRRVACASGASGGARRQSSSAASAGGPARCCLPHAARCTNNSP